MTGLPATMGTVLDTAAVLVIVSALLVGAVVGGLLARRRPRPHCTCTAAECKDSWHAAQGPCCAACSGHRGGR